MQPISSLLAKFKQSRADIEKLVATDLPRIIGIEAVAQVKSNFIEQGYEGSHWKPRAAATNKAYDRGRKPGEKYRSGRNKTYKGSVFRSGNPLLRQTGKLFRSIQYKITGKTVFIGSNTDIVPYAQRMNEGGGGVPARKFIPKPGEAPNAIMLTRIHKKAESEITKAMKKL